MPTPISQEGLEMYFFQLEIDRYRYFPYESSVLSLNVKRRLDTEIITKNFSHSVPNKTFKKYVVFTATKDFQG